MGEDEGEGDKIDYPSSLPSPARGEGIVWLRRHFVSWRNRLDQNLQKLILDKRGILYFLNAGSQEGWIGKSGHIFDLSYMSQEWIRAPGLFLSGKSIGQALTKLA
jgi:hypothetical protein